jgi:hypothetical protein
VTLPPRLASEPIGPIPVTILSHREARSRRLDSAIDLADELEIRPGLVEQALLDLGCATKSIFPEVWWVPKDPTLVEEVSRRALALDATERVRGFGG